MGRADERTPGGGRSGYEAVAEIMGEEPLRIQSQFAASGYRKPATLMEWYIGARLVETCSTEKEPILVGVVFDHSRRKDGAHIRSSRVLEIRGRLVRTAYTVYCLGRINEAFQILRYEDLFVDPDHPLGADVAHLRHLALEDDEDQICSDVIECMWPQAPTGLRENARPAIPTQTLWVPFTERRISSVGSQDDQ
jgi:hypothetical protein